MPRVADKECGFQERSRKLLGPPSQGAWFQDLLTIGLLPGAVYLARIVVHEFRRHRSDLLSFPRAFALARYAATV
jgi:hypothetical protein